MPVLMLTALTNQTCCAVLCCGAVMCVHLQARVLESVLAAGLGWDFRMTALLGSDSDDEFRPVVVELSEQQLAELALA